MKKILFLVLSLSLLSACTTQILQAGEKDFQQKNYSAAMEKLLPLANQGDPQAQYTVGYMYYTGQGIAKDKALGRHWIDQAASQGNIQAIKAQNILDRKQPLDPF